MPWQLFEYSAYKGDICEKCGCIRLHISHPGPTYEKRFLLNGKWLSKTPECPGITKELSNEKTDTDMYAGTDGHSMQQRG